MVKMKFNKEVAIGFLLGYFMIFMEAVSTGIWAIDLIYINSGLFFSILWGIIWGYIFDD